MHQPKALKVVNTILKRFSLNFQKGLEVIILTILNFLEEISPSSEKEKDEEENKGNSLILNFFEEFNVLFSTRIR